MTNDLEAKYDPNWYEKAVKELGLKGLPTRIQNVLVNERLSLSQAIALDDDQLLRFVNLGKKSIADFRRITMSETTKRSIILSNKQLAYLEKEAATIGITVSDLIRRIIDKYRDDRTKKEK